MNKQRKGIERRVCSPQMQDTVRLSADGLAKVLGDLEARIMRVMWDLNRAVPAREAHRRVVRTHRVALLTVVTVLNRLVAKGLLRREREEDLLHYSARLTEQEFMVHASRHVMEGVLGFSPDVVAASFVDVLAERDPDGLAALGRLIQRRLRERAAEE